ncbi:MAG: 50S ribosomal protein L23 [Clostridiales bacterium]|nr:MAG: 50S ribosomal protein L23 [Clostridiales bacterium]
MKFAHDIIVRPVVTEKSLEATKSKRYTFEVQKNATKPEIAQAVEEAFGVTVAKVNTINMKKKPKRLGVHAGYTKAWKKAIVTLKADSKTIEFFDGMI